MEGTIEQLRTESEFFSNLVGHGPEKGRLNELHLVKVLRNYLPEKFGIGTGFIVAGGETIQESPQCDIVIYDRHNNKPFFYSESWQIYPIEIVYGIIEVKTTLNKTTLRQAFKSCSKIRAMCGTQAAPNKAYVRQVPAPSRTPTKYTTRKSNLPPRFYVFAYKGPGPAAIQKAFTELSAEIRSAHIHGLCVLQKKSATLLRHRAYAGSEDRVDVEVDDGLLRFLMKMPEQLNSMLPVLNLETALPTAQPADDTCPDSGGVAKDAHDSDAARKFPYRFENFDLVDLEHYRNLDLVHLDRPVE